MDWTNYGAQLSLAEIVLYTFLKSDRLLFLDVDTKEKTITAIIAKSRRLRPLLRTMDAGVTGRELPRAMTAIEYSRSGGVFANTDPLRRPGVAKPPR